MINKHLVNHDATAVYGADISFGRTQENIRTPIGIVDDIFAAFVFVMNDHIVTRSPLGGFHKNDHRIFVFYFLGSIFWDRKKTHSGQTKQVRQNANM